MKRALLLFTVCYAGLFSSVPLYAQTVFPGKQTIDSKDYFGFNLTMGISDRHLSDYWQDFLKPYGKATTKRGVVQLSGASIPSLSGRGVVITSQITSQKGGARLFASFFADGRYIANFTDSLYRNTEVFLRSFSTYASWREEVRKAEEFYAEANRNHQRLQRENDTTLKEIERTEKRLEELRVKLETNKKDLAGSVYDLQEKQAAVEAVKNRAPR
jgi:hypothetical protein